MINLATEREEFLTIPAMMKPTDPYSHLLLFKKRLAAVQWIADNPLATAMHWKIRHWLKERAGNVVNIRDFR